MAFGQSQVRYSILCVDDDLVGLETRATVLEREGYSVTCLSCPLTALQEDMSKFHLAVIDFEMPALNGYQLLLRLRAAHASFPIVLLSGMSWDLPNDMRRLFSSCLDKGAPIQQLLDTVRGFLAASRDSTENSLLGTSAGYRYGRHGL
jgi:CheY-like chemotaxis protein